MPTSCIWRGDLRMSASPGARSHWLSDKVDHHVCSVSLSGRAPQALHLASQCRQNMCLALSSLTACSIQTAWACTSSSRAQSHVLCSSGQAWAQQATSQSQEGRGWQQWLPRASHALCTLQCALSTLMPVHCAQQAQWAASGAGQCRTPCMSASRGSALSAGGR